MGEGSSGGAGIRRRVRVVVTIALAVAAVAGACSSGGDAADGSTATTVAPASAPSSTMAPFVPSNPAVPVADPSQPAGVPGPTSGWQTAPLPAGADAARVEELVTRALGPDSTGLNSNTDAVLVVHQGKIVLERYRSGFGDASTVHRSWSS